MRHYLVLVVVLAWLPVAQADEPAKPAPLTEKQKERLKERDKFAEETDKLRAAGKLAEAIQAAAKMLAIEREVFGNFHEDVAGSLEQLAEMHEPREEFPAAQKARTEVLAIQEKLHGPGHWRTRQARWAQGDVERLTRLRKEERQQLVAASRFNQEAIDLANAGKYQEAVALARKAAKIRGELLGKQHPDYGTSLNNLGWIYRESKDLTHAESSCREALQVRKDALGNDHPMYAEALNNLGWVYSFQRKPREAEQCFREAAAVNKQASGEQSAGYAISLNNLALLYRDQEDYAKALPLFEQVSAVYKSAFGESHPSYLQSVNNLLSQYQAYAQLQEAQDDFASARRLRKAVLAIHTKADGEQHWRTTDARLALEKVDLLARLSRQDRVVLRQADEQNRRAWDLFRDGKVAEAFAAVQQALEVRRRILGEEHADCADSLNNLALLWEQKGDYEKALPLLQQALSVRKKTLGETHPYYAQSLNGLAFWYQTQKDYAKALAQFQQASEVQKKAVGTTHPDYAQSLNNLAGLCQMYAQSLEDRDDFAAARPLRERLVSIRSELVGEKHWQTTDARKAVARLNLLAGLSQQELAALRQGDEQNRKAVNFLGTGKSADALVLLQQALAVRKKILGEAQPEYAQSLSNLAQLYAGQGDYAKALPLAQQAVELTKNALGQEHPGYAHSLNNLAQLYHVHGEYAKALPLLQQAVEVNKKALGDGHANYAMSLASLANLYSAQGDNARALPLLQEALLVRKKALGEAHPDYAATLHSLGLLYNDQEDYAKALPLFQQASAICKKALGEESPHYATSLDGLARAYELQGDYATALPLYQQALAICKKALGEASPDYARCLYRLGVLYQEMQDDTKAIPLLKEAAVVAKKALGEGHPNYAKILESLAGSYRAQANYGRGIALDQQTLEMRRKALGEAHPDYAASLSNLALAYHYQGDYARALPLYRQALAALREQPGEAARPIQKLTAADLRAGSLTVRTLHNYGYCLQESAGPQPSAAQLSACDHAFALAFGVIDRLRSEVLERDESKLQHGAQWFNLVPLRIGVCRQLYHLDGNTAHLHDAYTAAEQGRARVFLEQLGKSRADRLGGVSPELRQREAALLARLKHYDVEIGKESYPETLKRLRQERRQAADELEQLMTKIDKRFPQYAALKQPTPCSLDEARACLADNEVALLFALGDQASYLVLVEARPAPDDPAEGIVVKPMPRSTDIADLVASLADPEVMALPARARTLGSDAYRLLLAPVAYRLRGKNLVIVPGEALCQLPFELLIEDHKYLIEKHGIRYAPSLTVLKMIRQWQAQRQPPDRGIWALGDPVYEPTDRRLEGESLVAAATATQSAAYGQREGRRSLAFSRLRYSGAEARAVQALVPRSKVRTDSDATEEAVKFASATGELARYRYIHFATHGILGFDTSQQPALVLSLVDNDGQPDDEGGVNDGFLRLDEVTRLKLNADLVVLSACRTGQGRLANGEGVIGLARAFLYAGSRGVVSTLWSVDDKETASLMTSFYGHLKDEQSAAAALQSTKLEMIKAGKPPLYWAPFILIGE